VTTATAEQSTSTTDRTRGSAFAALRLRTYRIYLTGHTVASTGAWIQSIALDWLVLERSGTPSAVGIVMACQFLPMLLLGMHGGLIADRFPKRSVLLVTQSLNALLSATIAVLTISGVVQVEHLYLLALVGGLVFVVDNPTRQVFVNEVVPADQARQAIALNAATFQASRLVGPAVAVVLIGTVGTGWAFATNAVSFLFPIAGLLLIRPAELQPAPRFDPAAGRLRDALRHVAARPRVAATIALVGVVGTFGLNFPIVLTAMAGEAFGGGAGLYGLFNIALAVGSVGGALVATRVRRPGMPMLVGSAAIFAGVQAAAATAPTVAIFCVLLAVLGVANLAFQAMANASVQAWVDPAVRGRVMGLYMLVFVGGTPLGAPMIGALTAEYGARAGMAVCGIVPLAACAALVLLRRRRSGVAVLVPA
jgi:MFS family permease